MSVTIQQRIPESRRWLHTASIWCVVVTIALLNPIACLIHCATMHRSDDSQIAAALSETHFLCLFPSNAPTAQSSAVGHSHSGHHHGSPAPVGDTHTPDPAAPTPRAVYDSLPLALALVVLTMALMHYAYVCLPTRVPQRFDAPPLPPPRFA